MKLYSLKVGDKFLWNNIRYTVQEQDRTMTEVWANGKSWAWPSGCSVNPIRN